jgi:hypothetical protein
MPPPPLPPLPSLVGPAETLSGDMVPAAGRIIQLFAADLTLLSLSTCTHITLLTPGLLPPCRLRPPAPPPPGCTPPPPIPPSSHPTDRRPCRDAVGRRGASSRARHLQPHHLHLFRGLWTNWLQAGPPLWSTGMCRLSVFLSCGNSVDRMCVLSLLYTFSWDFGPNGSRPGRRCGAQVWTCRTLSVCDLCG